MREEIKPLPLTLNQRWTQTNFFHLPYLRPPQTPILRGIWSRNSRAFARASRRAFERVVRVPRASSVSSRIRLVLEEGAFTSASASSPTRPSAIPFLSPDQVRTDSGGGGCTPVFFLQPFLSVSASRLSGSTFRVLTIGGKRSRVTVCRSGVWTMLQSVIVEGDRRGWEKRDDRARAIQRLAAPRENTISWGRNRGKDSGVQTLWERKFRYVRGLWILWETPRISSLV